MVDRASAVGSGSAHGAAARPPGADQTDAAEFRAVAQDGQPYIRRENKKYTEAEIRREWGANAAVAKRLAESTPGDKRIQVIHVIETASHYGPAAYEKFTSDEIVARLTARNPATSTTSWSVRRTSLF